MREIAISKFKATCLAVVDDVQKTRKPVRITKFGKPVAELVPLQDKPKKRMLGGLAGPVEFLGDLSKPIGAVENWEPEDL